MRQSLIVAWTAAIQKAERRDGPGRFKPGLGLHLQRKRSYYDSVSTDLALPGLSLPPVTPVQPQDEFFPTIENPAGLKPWQRPGAHIQVPLETTGVTSQLQQPELIAKSLLD